MSDNEAKVAITADASGVQAGVDQAKGSIEGLGPFIAETREKFATMGAQVEEAKVQFAGFGETAMGALAGVRTATESTAAAVSGMVMQVHGAAESVRTFQMRAKEFAELYVAVFALDQIKDVIQELTGASTKYTSEVERLSKTFRTTLAGADAFHAALGKLNIETSTVTGMGEKMVRQLRQHEDAFNRLGIVTRDTEGHFRDMQEVFFDGLDVIRNYQEGIDRNAASQILFGRGAGDLTQILRLNREELEEGKKTAEALNLQTTGEGVAAMHEYKEAVAEAGETWESFKIQLGHDLIPTLLSLAQWFRSDGPSAIKETIANINEFIAEIKTIPAIWNFVTASLDLALAGWAGFFEKINLWLWELEQKIILFGEVSTLALQGNIGQAEQVWEATLKQIGDIADRESARIVHAANTAAAAWEKARAEMSHALNPVDVGDTLFRDEKGRIDPDEYPMDKGAPPKDPTTGDGNRLDDIKQGHPKKEKKPKDDLVQRLDDELTARKLAWDQIQDQQDTAQAYSLEAEKKYWADILENVSMSAKDRGEVERKYLDVSKQLRAQQIAGQLAIYHDDEAAAGKNADAKLALVKQEVAYIGRMYGEQSDQYKQALKREIEAERAAAEQKRQIAQQLADELKKLEDLRISQEEADARFLVEIGLKTQGQLIADERNFENQRYAAALADAQRRKAIIDPDRDPVAYAKANAEIETLDRQHQNTLTQIDQRAILQRTAIERQAINQLSSSWGQAIGQLVTLQQGFASTIKALWQGLQQAIGNAIASIIQNWLTQHLSALLIGGAASKASAVGQIANEAAIAGASGVASYAAAPWPIDMGAPAFGASMAAAAAAFGSGLSVPSGAGGIWDVPGGLTMLHENEMVLPAWAATPLRSMISGAANNNAPFPGNDGGGGGGASGDVHLHLHGDIIHNPSQLEAWFKKNASAVGAGVRHYVRQGGKTSL